MYVNVLPVPESPQKYLVCPASPEEAGLFYALTPEQDEALGAIGHVRIDFGRSGKDFWHTWHPRGVEELNSPEFKAELDEVVGQLRESVLRDLTAMRSYCNHHGGEIEGGICTQNYGYTVETERYRYLLRCNPIEGDYQAYLSCFDKQEQELGQNALVADRAASDKRARRSLLKEESSQKEEYTSPKTVRDIIQKHPGTSIHLLSPDGYFDFTPEEAQALLRGGVAISHPRVAECFSEMDTEMLLNQFIIDENWDGDSYEALTDYTPKTSPASREHEISDQQPDMQMGGM